MRWSIVVSMRSLDYLKCGSLNGKDKHQLPRINREFGINTITI